MPTKTPEKPGAIEGGATLVGVGIWNLHVIITSDDGSFFAQAAEIDYAAQGDSLEDVKGRFQQGLCATIHEHLTVYGNIEHLVHPAPPEVWKEIFGVAEGAQHEYSQLSVHFVPFTQIEYILPKAA